MGAYVKVSRHRFSPNGQTMGRCLFSQVSRNIFICRKIRTHPSSWSGPERASHHFERICRNEKLSERKERTGFSSDRNTRNAILLTARNSRLLKKKEFSPGLIAPGHGINPRKFTCFILRRPTPPRFGSG